MTIFAIKKIKIKKCKAKSKKDRWIQITNRVNVPVVNESGVHGWPLVSVWGGMTGVFGYYFLTYHLLVVLGCLLVN